MATYKVLQDIEAEDKLVGPLSLRQFIYACLSAFCLYICFLGLTRGAEFLVVIFLPVAVISGFFGFPWKSEQSTEIWALARLRFMVKPRTRIWNQDGMKEVVTVTAPRRAPVRQQRNLSQIEVRSRLRALADTIDSRGWATRNANYQFYMSQQHPASDRLVNASGLQPGSIPMDAFLPSNDMMDDQNPVAQNFNALLAKSNDQNRQRAMQGMAQAQMPQAPQPAGPAANTVAGPSGGMRVLSPQLPAPAMPFAPPSAAYTQPSGMMPPMPPAYAPAPAAPSIHVPAAAMPMMPAMPSAMPPQAPALPPPVQNDSWFMQAPGYPSAAPQQQQQIAQRPPDSAAVEEQLVQQMVNGQASTLEVNLSHLRVLQPNGTVPDVAPVAPVEPPAAPVTRQADPAILELANNDDLDVATLARQANKDIKKVTDEVEIKLH